MADPSTYSVLILVLLSSALHVMSLLLVGQMRVPMQRSFKIYGYSAVILGFPIFLLLKRLSVESPAEPIITLSFLLWVPGSLLSILNVFLRNERAQTTPVQALDSFSWKSRGLPYLLLWPLLSILASSIIFRQGEGLGRLLGLIFYQIPPAVAYVLGAGILGPQRPARRLVFLGCAVVALSLGSWMGLVGADWIQRRIH
jgi:hypothetical protein